MNKEHTLLNALCERFYTQSELTQFYALNYDIFYSLRFTNSKLPKGFLYILHLYFAIRHRRIRDPRGRHHGVGEI
jgi:hypothetical protein